MREQRPNRFRAERDAVMHVAGRGVARRLVSSVALAALATACGGGFAPLGPPAATDIGFLGCQVATPPDAIVRTGEPLGPGEPMAGVPVTTMTPRQVGEAARARGLKVTWRYSYFLQGDPSVGANECWCEPPPEGRVEGVAYGSASELVVFVEAGIRLPELRTPPPRGFGCP